MSSLKYKIDPETDPGIQRRRAITRRVERRRYYWLGYALIVLILDQLSKWAVMELILRPRFRGVEGKDFFTWYIDPPPLMPTVGVEVTSFFNFVMVWNKGVSFGLLRDYGDFMPYVLIAAAIFITGFFVLWLLDTKDPVKGISFALVIGGALGNVIDRIRFHAVIDFLDFHIYGYHWPAFNVADMAVVIGIGVLIVTSLIFDLQKKHRYRERKKRRRKAQQTSGHRY